MRCKGTAFFRFVQILMYLFSQFNVFSYFCRQLMQHKSRSIVLRTIKLGDNKLIADLLSREEGRVSAVCKISTSRTAKIRKQLFQPLTILEVDTHRLPRQKMSQLTDARIVQAYTTLPFDAVKLSLGFFVAEFLVYATRDMHPEPLLYDFVEQSLTWLDNSERGTANFHLMFMIRMSRFLGFFPDVESFREGAVFDLREGAFSTTVPLHRDFLIPEDAKKMQVLMRMTPSNLHLFRLSREERNRIVDFCLQFYKLHIPQFGDMKSLDVLKELFR